MSMGKVTPSGIPLYCPFVRNKAVVSKQSAINLSQVFCPAMISHLVRIHPKDSTCVYCTRLASFCNGFTATCSATHIMQHNVSASLKNWCIVQGLPSSHKAMPMALCQIVAHEVNLENIRSKDKVHFCAAALPPSSPLALPQQLRSLFDYMLLSFWLRVMVCLSHIEQQHTPCPGRSEA